MTWKKETLKALHRYANRQNTNIVNRKQLIKEELDNITKTTYSYGVTPDQTLSRTLQELRDEGILYFLGSGRYLFLDKSIHVETENLPERAIDFAIKKGKLLIGKIETGDKQAVTRQRLGQNRIRQLTLQNYKTACALCDENNEELLDASHISRWVDDPDARGNLSNIICLCKFHHILFEKGLISLSDTYQILEKPTKANRVVEVLLDLTKEFKKPKAYPPTAEFLFKHRKRAGF